MKAWTRVLLVVHLILAVAAFALGMMLFERREILIGRTLSLESAITALGATLQRASPIADMAPEFPERDIGPVGWDAQPLQPQAEFWKGYDSGLEHSVGDTWALQNRRVQLSQYYRLDPLTLKPLRDPISGERLTTGKGTMHDLLAQVQRSAVSQRDTLDRTQDALTLTREELVDTIADLNGRKIALRGAHATIRDRDHTLQERNRELIARAATIEKREHEISDLKDLAHDLETAVALRDERIEDLENDVETLETLIATGGGPGGTGFAPSESIERGMLGTVTAVSTEWGFVTVAFEPRFTSQYAHLKSRTGRVRQLNVMITRPDEEYQRVVGKARLNWINPEDGVGVADVLMIVSEAKPGDQLVY